MEKRKMKIGKYISLSINTLIWFILAWIIIGAVKLSSDFSLYAYSAAGVIALIAFSAITINVFVFSLVSFLKSIKNIKQENGLWKILTLVFKIGMLVFATLILIFWIVWLSNMIKWGFKSTESSNILENLGYVSYYYISGGNGWYKYVPGGSSFPLYVTSFVFILLWAAAGIAFEILKKFLGGYKNKTNENNENNNSNETTATF